MELSYTDLKKRDVVNVNDGKCFGKIIDLSISFPSATLAGISVPGGKRNFLFRLFDRSSIFIEESKIIRIGSDVILVDVKCGDVCGDNTRVAPPQKPPMHRSPPCGCGEIDNPQTPFASGNLAANARTKREDENRAPFYDEY